MAFSIDALNTIRANASADYQNRIPEATRENLAAIGQAFKTYQPLYNEFCDTLINRIGLTLIEQASFSNKLKHFKTGEITDDQDVQEIFVSMAKAEGAYDPEGKNPLGRRNPAEVKAAYHRLNRRDKYAISIGDRDFKRNFTTPAMLDAFISAQLQSIYTGDEYDEWVLFKNLFATYAFDGNSYTLYEVPKLDGTNNATAAKQFIKTVKKAVQDQSFMSTEYNTAKVMRAGKTEGMTLLINKDMMPEIDVEVLMGAFNADKASIKPNIITMDDFGSLTTDAEGNVTYGILFERGFCRIFDTLMHTEPIRNPDGLFTNTFLHHHQILSLSPFKNAIRLVAK